MTILALRVFSPELAALWTDSECHSLNSGRPSRRRNKLVVGGSSVACIAGGWDALAREADHVTCEARDIDGYGFRVTARLLYASPALTR